MTDGKNETALTIVPEPGQLRNKTANVPAIRRSEDGAADYVAHLSVGQVTLLAVVAGQGKRNGERNSLLIKTLLDGAFRVSEALGIRPCDLVHTSDGWLVSIMGKGSKPGTAAITANTVLELEAYCYRHKIPETERIFPFTRSQAFRIVTAAFDKAGIRRPGRETDHVGGGGEGGDSEARRCQKLLLIDILLIITEVDEW